MRLKSHPKNKKHICLGKYKYQWHYVLGGLGEEEGLHAVLEGVVAHVLHRGVPAVRPRRVLRGDEKEMNSSQRGLFLWWEGVWYSVILLFNDICDKGSINNEIKTFDQCYPSKCLPGGMRESLISRLDMCSILLHGKRGDKLPSDRAKEGHGGRKIIPACPCLSSRVEHPTSLSGGTKFQIQGKGRWGHSNDGDFWGQMLLVPLHICNGKYDTYTTPLISTH